MRATSIRRKEPNRSYYRGTETPIQRKTHDYSGDGPSFMCPECGARVSSVRPAHAPGGGKSKPWSRCGGLTVADDSDLLPSLGEREAAEAGLITRQEIADHFGVAGSTIRLLQLPDPVARHETRPGAPWLYQADVALRAVQKQKPKWKPQVTP